MQPSLMNPHRVAKSQWKKWDAAQQSVFNDVYEQMRDNQHYFLHPKADPIPPEHWQTTAWNAAWTAADAMRDVNAVAQRKVA